MLYGTTFHVYQSLEEVVTWNTYRAARLACNIITNNLSCFLNFTEAQNTCIGYETSLDLVPVQATIRSLVDDICASVVYLALFKVKSSEVGSQGLDMAHFDSNMRSINVNTFYKVTDITARRAFLLVWPLSISLATSGSVICKEQREWIRSKLALISRITGSRSLAIVSS